MIQQALIIAFAIYGWFACFWDKAIFGSIGNWLKDRLPEYITKPLFACPICMIPWYGVPLYLFVWGWQIEMLPVIFGAMGINAMMVTIENKLEDIADAVQPD